MNRVDIAMKHIRRADFLPISERDNAHEDQPLPIGFGQTNSQPSTVRQMLKWLDVRPGMKVLDLGSGSGWTTALLSYLVGSKGFIYAVERIPELLSMGAQNCMKYHLDNVEFHQAGETLGLSMHAPYDRILVSAAAGSLPHPLIDQLAAGGRMVVPVGHTVLEIDKMTEETYETVEHDGFIFVPLIGWLNQAP